MHRCIVNASCQDWHKPLVFDPISSLLLNDHTHTPFMSGTHHLERHLPFLWGLQVQWWSYFLSNATSRCRASQWPSAWDIKEPRPLVLPLRGGLISLTFRNLILAKADEMRGLWLFVIKIEAFELDGDVVPFKRCLPQVHFLFLLDCRHATRIVPGVVSRP